MLFFCWLFLTFLIHTKEVFGMARERYHYGVTNAIVPEETPDETLWCLGCLTFLERGEEYFLLTLEVSRSQGDPLDPTYDREAGAYCDGFCAGQSERPKL